MAGLGDHAATATATAARQKRLGEEPEPTLARAAPDPAQGQIIGRGGRLGRGPLAWALYEGARDPYVIIITIYIFGPYFATAVVGDPVRGQALVATIAMFTGLFVAATGPLLGASIDLVGPRKPLLFLMTALLIPALISLWWVKPRGGGVGLGVASMILFFMGVAFVYSEILHNSMLTRAATPAQAPHASGLALSLGNFFSVFMLAFVLWAFVLPGKVSWGFLPKHPLLGLDPITRQPDRIVGPLIAVVMAILATPLFFFTPDAPPTGVPVLRALGQGFEGLKATLRTLKGHRAAATFLGARMLYTDGMTALLVFAGVFAAGVMKWGTLELLTYGIVVSIFAVVGGQVGARLDAALGPKRAIQIEIFAAAAAVVGIVGMGRNQILYVPFDTAAHSPLWNGPMFRTLPEVVFVCIGCVSAVFVTAQYASSRTFLTRLAPEGRSASFFGLYALSGTVTMWLGSMLVRIFTGIFKTQQAGFAPIALLLILGFIAMLFVRNDGRSAAPAP